MVAYLSFRRSPASTDDILLGRLACCLRAGLERPKGILLKGANSFSNLRKLSSMIGSSEAFSISKNERFLLLGDPLMSVLYLQNGTDGFDVQIDTGSI